MDKYGELSRLENERFTPELEKPVEKKLPNQQVEQIQNTTSERTQQQFERLDFVENLSLLEQQNPPLAKSVETALKEVEKTEAPYQGHTMDTHFTYVMRALNDVKAGRFPEQIDTETKRLLENTIVVNSPDGKIINPQLVAYAILQEFSHPDSLTLTLEGVRGSVDVCWPQWQEIRARGTPYYYLDDEVTRGYPVRVQSATYSQGEDSNPHLPKDFALMADMSLPDAVQINARHDVAYNFGPINAQKYEEEFVLAGLNDGQQKFAIAAAYLDAIKTAGASDSDGMKNFTNLVRSRDNYRLIADTMNRVTASGRSISPEIRKNIKVLAVKPESLQIAEVERAVARKTVEFEKLRMALQRLEFADGRAVFSPTDIGEIVNELKFHPDLLDASSEELPVKIAAVKPIIDACTSYEI